MLADVAVADHAVVAIATAIHHHGLCANVHVRCNFPIATSFPLMSATLNGQRTQRCLTQRCLSQNGYGAKNGVVRSLKSL